MDMQEVPGSQRALLIALGVATFMVGLDGRVVAPLLPTIADDFRISVADAGWLVSAYMLPYGLCQLAYGPLAERFGKVRVATHAMLWFSVGTALCGVFDSFATIVLLRALTGAAAAGLIPLTIAYIGDTVPYERRQATLAMFVASAGAAQAFSTSAGGVIAAVVSWRHVFPILGVLAGAATLALFAYRSLEIRLAPDPSAPPPRARDALRAPGMVRLLSLVAWEGALFIGGFSFLSGLLEQRFELAASSIGLILGSAGVSQVVAARILPRLLKRWSERMLIAIGGSGMACAHLLSALAPHWSLIVVSCVLVGFGFSMCHSTLQTRATEAFARARGTALSLFAFSLFSGSALGTVCVGYGSELLGYGPTFALLGGLMFIFTLLAARSRN